jgi:23S rRNA (uracil1939-C5)-methyltransferase
VNGTVLFVPFAVPGDVVDVQLTKRRSSYLEGYVARLVSPSPLRQAPLCEHYGACGGCKWQILPYAEQLRYKQRQVEEQLVRIGNLRLPTVRPIIGAAQTTLYRNKLEFTFSHQRWVPAGELCEGQPPADAGAALGFHVPTKFDKVVDIRRCYLQADPSNAIRLFVKQLAVENNLAFFDLREQSGLLRNLIIRTATTGEVMVVVVFAKGDEAAIELVMRSLAREFPQITALLYVVNAKRNDSIADQQVVPFAGRPYIVEQLEGLRFHISAKSFYQTSSAQACLLYRAVRELAALGGGELVYDLYTGTGTIACFLAPAARQVVGVELVEEAIGDARANAQRNGLTNVAFHVGDMKDVLTSAFFALHGKPDMVVLDPPRAGLHPRVAQALLEAAPRRIVYVSCNPATQARDLALLDQRYAITAVQPVDMFPHTHHVENVAALELR